MNSVTELQDVTVKEANRLITYLQDNISHIILLGIRILFAVVIFWAGKKIIQILIKPVDRFFARSIKEESGHHFMVSLSKAGMYLALAGILASIIGIPSSSFAALIASIGVGVGLALKESMSNLAGGLILLMTKPFSAGEYVREDGHGNEGTVQKIGLFYTTLVTPDNQVIHLPNGILANSGITNVSGQKKRELRYTVGISYGSDLKKAKALIIEILDKDHFVMQEEQKQVFVDDLGDSAVIIGWRAWVATEDYWAAKWSITEKIKLVFDKEGIEIPFNQLDINIAASQQNAQIPADDSLNEMAGKEKEKEKRRDERRTKKQ
ncbi:MAG: mechanosensitive ion channel family protein [Clostridiales bacterium]|nr:mechanosensitive ion channel family protein [Clostridiales bacterium]